MSILSAILESSRVARIAGLMLDSVQSLEFLVTTAAIVKPKHSLDLHNASFDKRIVAFAI